MSYSYKLGKVIEKNIKNRVPKTLPCGTYLLVNFHDNAAESITLSYKLTLSKKKLKGNVAFIPTAILVYFASPTLIQHVYANYLSFGAFRRSQK